MNTNIRRIESKDLAAVLDLMREFAEFEKLSDWLTTTEDRLHTAMFGGGAFVEGLIAEKDGRAVAYALFYPHFSSFRGERGYYLEDIYISASCRHQGLGEAMIRAIAQLGRAKGFERIDFQVLDWNAPAIRFYEKLGAVRDEEDRHFKFTDDAFGRLAGD